MSWRDNLRQAKFRNVEFAVASTSTGIGRRNIVHQFPFQEIPFVEDIGSDADEFTIEGFIIHDFYIAEVSNYLGDSIDEMFGKNFEKLRKKYGH